MRRRVTAAARSVREFGSIRRARRCTRVIHRLRGPAGACSSCGTKRPARGFESSCGKSDLLQGWDRSRRSATTGRRRIPRSPGRVRRSSRRGRGDPPDSPRSSFGGSDDEWRTHECQRSGASATVTRSDSDTSACATSIDREPDAGTRYPVGASTTTRSALPPATVSANRPSFPVAPRPRTSPEAPSRRPLRRP